MAKYYVSYSSASHMIHREGCPDLDRAHCIFLGDFCAITLAVPVANTVLFEEAAQCTKCLDHEPEGRRQGFRRATPS